MNRFEIGFLAKHLSALRSSNFSFSNEGEDIALLKEIGSGVTNGFYVDVGSNHPIRYNNMMSFYLRGWSGINIDALPGSKKIFDKIRKRDINVEMGVSTRHGSLTYYSFKESALNTFSEEMAKTREKEGFTCVSQKKIRVMPLSEILDKYLPEGRKIDIMDIDVEGMDYEVIRSNDWERYRPVYVLAEAIGSGFSDILSGDITSFLSKQGYEPYMKFVGTVVYRRV